MRKLISASAVFGAIFFTGGCASVPSSSQSVPSSSQIASTEVAVATQTVKIYDVAPPNASPIDQVSATACNGTREAATDRVIALASQRGANGITQLSCKTEGISLACWSSATCTAVALNVPPPPPPPLVRAKRVKPKAKAKR